MNAKFFKCLAILSGLICRPNYFISNLVSYWFLIKLLEPVLQGFDFFVIFHQGLLLFLFCLQNTFIFLFSWF